MFYTILMNLERKGRLAPERERKITESILTSDIKYMCNSHNPSISIRDERLEGHKPVVPGQWPKLDHATLPHILPIFWKKKENTALRFNCFFWSHL